MRAVPRAGFDRSRGLNVYGLDPSLAGFGISDGERHEVIKTQAGIEISARSALIVKAVRHFVTGDGLEPIASLHFFVEAPAPGIAAGSSNPYDRGWLDCDLHRLARFLGAKLTMVSPGTWLKYVTGKGNFPKERLALHCFKKYGIEIEDDKGANKLEAYCIWRYGQAVVSGEIEHVPIAQRGAGKRKKAS